MCTSKPLITSHTIFNRYQAILTLFLSTCKMFYLRLWVQLPIDSRKLPCFSNYSLKLPHSPANKFCWISGPWQCPSIIFLNYYKFSLASNISLRNFQSHLFYWRISCLLYPNISIDLSVTLCTPPLPPSTPVSFLTAVF